MTAPTTLTPQPGILDISPYTAGEAHVAGSNKVTKLSANENPLGPSPKAIAAAKRVAEEMALYPSTDHSALRTAIADIHGLDVSRIVCGAGSDEIIALLCQAYAGPGDTVLHTEHGFAMYPISAHAAGATPVSVPETERHADVDRLLAAVDGRTRLVFLANPNNPTGTLVDASEVERLAAGLPDHALLVLDGAYAEYVDEAGYDAGIGLIDSGARVVMTRTFSKVYGLGGLRVGWAYGPADVIDVLNRVRGPFNVSAMGLAAAEAAVRDTEYTAEAKAENARWLAWLSQELRVLGIDHDQSFANFLLARFATEAAALEVDAALRARGVIVRRVAGYGFPEALRISVGDEVACRLVVSTLQSWRDGGS